MGRGLLVAALVVRWECAASVYCHADTAACGHHAALSTATAWPAVTGEQSGAPVFVDFDMDGDLDIVFGERGAGCSGPGQCDDNAGLLSYYRNDGDAAQAGPWFKIGNWMDITNGNRKLEGSAPTFGDVDGDGDIDMVLGYYLTDLCNNNVNTRLQYWVNDGSGTLTHTATTWTKRSDNPTLEFCLLAPQEKDQNVRPVLVDIDGDGDLDLVIGSDRPAGTNSDLHLLINSGNATHPSFALVNPSFSVPTLSGVKTGLSGDEFFAPAFGDMDGDGDLDLLLGTKVGFVYRYLLRESRSQFDSLPLTSLIWTCSSARRRSSGTSATKAARPLPPSSSAPAKAASTRCSTRRRRFQTPPPQLAT